jgi:hypothetical protein
MFTLLMNRRAQAIGEFITAQQQFKKLVSKYTECAKLSGGMMGSPCKIAGQCSKLHDQTAVAQVSILVQ